MSNEINDSDISINSETIFESLINSRLHYQDDLKFFKNVKEFKDIPGTSFFDAYRAARSKAFDRAENALNESLQSITSFANFLSKNQETMTDEDYLQAALYVSETANDFSEHAMSLAKQMVLTAIEQGINQQKVQLVLEYTLTNEVIDPLKSLRRFAEETLPSCLPVIDSRLNDIVAVYNAITVDSLPSASLSQNQVENLDVMPSTRYVDNDVIYLLHTMDSDPDGDLNPMLGEVVKSHSPLDAVTVNYINPDGRLTKQTVNSIQLRHATESNDINSWRSYKEGLDHHDSQKPSTDIHPKNNKRIKKHVKMQL